MHFESLGSLEAELVNISIRARPDLGLANITPRYDAEAGVLVADKTPTPPVPYGMHIGGVVLDLDPYYCQACFELLLREKYWTIDNQLSIPRAIDGQVEFDRLAVKRQSFDVEMVVSKNPQLNLVQILFGSTQHTSAIRLSPAFFALIRGDSLCGFMARLN